MTLKELKIGESAVIDTVGGTGELRQHFLDMGLIPGEKVTLVKFAPMGDPMELQIHGYELTLRLDDATLAPVEQLAAGVLTDRPRAGCIDLSAAGDAAGFTPVWADEIALMTSGTTGTPKLVLYDGAAITAQLDALNALEKAGSHDLDALCRAFGDLLGAVFAFREDIWSPTLQAMGRGLGGFIYLMDAYDDLPKDARKGQFNALQELHDTLPPTEFEDRCHDLLTQQMGLCAQQFELLPILKETPEGKLLYNTIYSGVWSKYAPIRKHREGKQK